MNNYLLSASALLFAACSSGDLIPVEFTAEGAQEVVISRIDPDRLYPWDTVKIPDGILDIELPLDSSGSTFYILAFDNNGVVRLGIERGDDIEGELTVANEITTYSLSGSKLSERLLAHYQPVRHSALLTDSLVMESKSYQGAPDEAVKNAELTARFIARVEKHRQEIESMITEEPASLANIFAFVQLVDNYPIFNPVRDSTLIRTTSQAMVEAHPNHPILQLFMQEFVK